MCVCGRVVRVIVGMIMCVFLHAFAYAVAALVYKIHCKLVSLGSAFGTVFFQ